MLKHLHHNYQLFHHFHYMYVDIFVKAWHTCDLQLSVNSLLLESDFFTFT